MKPQSIIPASILVMALLLALHPAALAEARGQKAGNSGEKLEVNHRVLFAIVGWMYDIDPGLLEAIATVESGGRSSAISPKGAQGLMQLMPGTALRFDVRDPYDPIDNALGAARFISFLRVRQAADIGAADLPALIAAYNAGEGSVRKYRGIPPYAETRDYVRKVLWLYLMGSNRPQRSFSATQFSRTPAVHPVGDGDVLERLSSIRRARAAARRTATVQTDTERP